MSANAHRPYAMAGLVCLLLVGVPFGLAASIPPSAALAGAFMGWALAMYLSAFTGALLAATTFSRGDPQRPGWLLLAAAYVVLVPMRLAAGVDPTGLVEAPQGATAVRVVASTLSSAGILAGFLLLATAWRRSGLDDSRTWVRALGWLAGVAIATALVGRDVVQQFPAAAAGDLLAIGNIATDLLDAAVFAVSVPVLRAAVALGGGVVAWPWTFLTVSLVGWLGFDVLAVLDGPGLPRAEIRTAEEVCRSVACLFALAAGVAQRWIMSSPPGAGAAD